MRAGPQHARACGAHKATTNAHSGAAPPLLARRLRCGLGRAQVAHWNTLLRSLQGDQAAPGSAGARAGWLAGPYVQEDRSAQQQQLRKDVVDMCALPWPLNVLPGLHFVIGVRTACVRVIWPRGCLLCTPQTVRETIVRLGSKAQRPLARRRFTHSYDNYMAHAFPHDELKPLSLSYTDSLGARLPRLC